MSLGIAIALIAAAAAAAPVDLPRRYLASIVALPLRRGERTSGFRFDTWGIDVIAICHLLAGWRNVRLRPARACPPPPR